jgi:ABC-type branched-chain amino acid transport systems, periplasmic component
MTRSWTRATVVAATVSLLLAGCGAAGDAGASDGGVPTAKIGSVLTMTGFPAVFGQEQKAGIELAVEQINKEGKAKLDFSASEDTGEANATALNAYRKVAADKPVVIFGPIIGTQVLAMRSEIQRSQIPLITTAATRSLTEGENRYVFRNFPHSGMSASAEAEFVFDQLKLTRPAILADNTAFGQGDAAVLRQGAKERGLSIVADEKVDPAAVDVTGQVSRILRAKADVVFVQLLTGSPLAIAVKTLRSQGFTGAVIAAPGITSPSTLKLLTDAEVNEVYSPGLALNAENAATKSFIDAFKAKYNKDPDIYAAVMYDSAMAVGQAVAAGNTTAESVGQALRTTQYSGITGTLRADKEGNLAHVVSILQFDDHKKASTKQTIDVKFEPSNG